MNVMQEGIVLVKGTFYGIYEWGEGYLDGKRSLWYEALGNVKDVFWKVVSRDDSQFLISIGGNVFLHPMGFNAVFYNGGCHSADSFHCGALERICNKIAEHCGGKFLLEVSKPGRVDMELYKYEEGIHNTLSR